MTEKVPGAISRVPMPKFGGGVLRSAGGDTTDRPKALLPVSVLSDTAWADLKTECGLPEITRSGCDCRALLELELAKARDDIALARRAVPIKKLRDQLGRIARSRIGGKLPAPLLADVVGLLAGRALGHAFDFASHGLWMEKILAQRTVTQEIRQWARESIWLGGRWRAWGGPHGGGANYGEQMFVHVLLFFWRVRLGRELTNWVGERYRKFVTGPEESAASLTIFVTRCLDLAGASSARGEPITLSMARDRITRAMRVTQAAI